MATTTPDPKTGWSPRLGIKAKRISKAPFKSLICNYEDNMRSALYSHNGKPCCFSPDEPAVVARIESLLAHGQLSPIKVWADARGRPHVSDGFLRYFCFSLLADQGRLEEIPGAGKEGFMLVDKVPRPKSPEDHLHRAEANLHDNLAKPLTPVDMAFALRRLALPVGDPGGEHGLGLEEAGKRIAPLAGRTFTPGAVRKYLQLLSLHPRVLGQVHRGELAMTQAIRQASESGEGNTRGPRPTVKVPTLRGLSEHLPKTSPEAKILRWILDPETHKPPPSIAAAMKAAAKAKQEANGKKKAPPRPAAKPAKSGKKKSRRARA